MASVILISCSKTKQKFRSRAEDLYVSPLFRKSLLYAVSRKVPYFILSAKHGLLAPETWIDPYDVTLKAFSESERDAWGERVVAALAKRIKSGDTVILLTGNSYREPVELRLRRLGISVEAPLSGKSMGQRLALLRGENRESELIVLHRRFYRCVERLYHFQDGGVLMADATGRMDWPLRGVYFLLEDSEQGCGGREFRITRVGTHAVSRGSKTSLWDRLVTHRGGLSGVGSHRSSIFRLHVGRALIAAGLHPPVPTWGTGQTAERTIRDEEVDLERAVTQVIGRMHVLWLGIADEAGPTSDRSYVERNSIALLSRHSILRPTKSHDWLGNWSSSHEISASGLWNLNFLYDAPDPRFIDVFETYVDGMTGKEVLPDRSIAPADWYTSTKLKTDSTQLALFADDTM